MHIREPLFSKEGLVYPRSARLANAAYIAAAKHFDRELIST